MTCKEEAHAQITRLWRSGPSTWGECDHVFDVNGDGEINILDTVIIENYSEAECCDLMKRYNRCLGIEPGFEIDMKILIYAAVVLVLIIILLMRG